MKSRHSRRQNEFARRHHRRAPALHRIFQDVRSSLGGTDHGCRDTPSEWSASVPRQTRWHRAAAENTFVVEVREAGVDATIAAPLRKWNDQDSTGQCPEGLLHPGKPMFAHCRSGGLFGASGRRHHGCDGGEQKLAVLDDMKGRTPKFRSGAPCQRGPHGDQTSAGTLLGKPIDMTRPTFRTRSPDDCE